MAELGEVKKVEHVKVPEEMYKKLEARAMRASQLEEALKQSAEALRSYRVIGVITSPPTAGDAEKVFAAVETLITLAQGVK